MPIRKATRKRAKIVKQKGDKNSSWHAVPLKGSFMILAIFGFFISVFLVFPTSPRFGLAFMLVFVAMFIASIVSMTKAPVVE